MQINHHSQKEHAKMSKITKFGYEMLYHFRLKCGSNFRTQYKSIQNLQTLQGYIFRILQHFATKLCNFTHFSMLFPGIYFFLPR
jgi:hypothetical protein